jgi:hypothetical protein
VLLLKKEREMAGVKGENFCAGAGGRRKRERFKGGRCFGVLPVGSGGGLNRTNCYRSKD